jgi:hypothetical protein
VRRLAGPLKQLLEATFHLLMLLLELVVVGGSLGRPGRDLPIQLGLHVRLHVMCGAAPPPSWASLSRLFVLGENVAQACART